MVACVAAEAPQGICSTLEKGIHEEGLRQRTHKPLAFVSCEYPLTVFPVKARSVPLPSATLLFMSQNKLSVRVPSCLHHC